jgi:biotin carboxyl carrier protein
LIVEIEVEGQRRAVDVRREGAGWIVTVGDRAMTATVVEIDGRWSLLIGPVEPVAIDATSAWRSYEVSFEPADDGVTLVRVDGNPAPVRVVDPRLRFSRRQRDAAAGGEGRRVVVAPMPGRVVKLLVERGQTVAARQGVVVVEAMKMENELRAPRAGTVSEVLVSEGMSVEAHATLMVIE